MQWASKEQLTDLLCEMVQIPSISGSEAEKIFPTFVEQKLRTLPYFSKHPEQIELHDAGSGMRLLSALVRNKPEVRETIVLLSHFDVVDTSDYGDFQQFAFDPRRLTELFRSQPEVLPPEARHDAENGEWLFGRGVMDMKSGLALQMAMLERASAGEFAGNLLLVTVPDEEVGSAGMRAAVPALLALAERYGLDYVTVLNSEPGFPKYAGDHSNYIYKGTIGKMLPGFLCYGKETHVGEALAGLNANYMVSRLISEMELNTSYIEKVETDITPPPTNLLLRSLKNDYSVQTPYRAAAMFNLLMLERTLEETIESLLATANQAARHIEADYAVKARACADYAMISIPDLHIKVLTYEELHQYAVATYGQERVEALAGKALKVSGPAGDRDTTIAIVDELALLCKELGPMIVLFFSPPYYPAVSSRHDPFIQKVADELADYAAQRYGMKIGQENFHRGICDLSYVGTAGQSAALQLLAQNMPMWEKGYSIPFKELEQFIVPVLNVGPVGLDAHKWTERLDVHNAFVVMMDLLPACIHTLFHKHNAAIPESEPAAIQE
ncbi:Arginine utilization protein RocB [Paenibacillus algorifonticola]|uniref:Arginine utilization protein RocB n=2 Tax=Paenibacillus algorifonticola TaxID=684063 RepID=A0A1I2J1X3_9BACL|nr:Arginine utilization protein RocB [Paenibacillus algorifonticola]